MHCFIASAHPLQSLQSADRDRSGKLSGAEVRGCLKSLGFNLPDATLDKVWKSVDDDASGQVRVSVVMWGARFAARHPCLP